MEALKIIVAANLNDAVANGYSFDGFTPADIVADLMAYAEDCENVSEECLRPCVDAWLAQRVEV